MILQGYRWIHGAVALLALFLGYLSVKMLIADIAVFQASSFTRDWSVKNQLTSEQAWNVAFEAADRAVRFSPFSNATHFVTLARVYEWKHISALPGDQSSAVSRRQALDAYRSAVAARPNWPYTWARIAHLKFNLLEFDQEFDEALHNAFHFGPWRWRVNRDLVRTGLLSWRELSPEQKLLIAQAFENLRLQKPAMAEEMRTFANKLHVRDELMKSIDTLEVRS